jgi:hypothetical protein
LFTDGGEGSMYAAAYFSGVEDFPNSGWDLKEEWSKV